MSAEEKVGWYQMLALTLAFGLVVVGVPGVAGQPRAVAEGFVAFGVVLAIYLLILSWRGAYLAGQKKSEKKK